jgi:alkylation response protein AidB-like acyl-CoA dehydrogenase
MEASLRGARPNAHAGAVGKPIGSFQALPHKATDLYVQQELARGARRAVRELDANGRR